MVWSSSHAPRDDSRKLRLLKDLANAEPVIKAGAYVTGARYNHPYLAQTA